MEISEKHETVRFKHNNISNLENINSNGIFPKKKNCFINKIEVLLYIFLKWKLNFLSIRSKKKEKNEKRSSQTINVSSINLPVSNAEYGWLLGKLKVFKNLTT